MWCSSLISPNITNCELCNQRPQQPQNELQLAINNILSTNVEQLNPTMLDEFQRLVHILGLLDIHDGSKGVSSERFIAEDLEEVDKEDLSTNYISYIIPPTH